MTFAEILNTEAENWNRVYLYREGIFLKAYQHSACLVHLYVHEFKLSCRYIKSVNEKVISLGFPQETAPKWLNRHKYYNLNEKIVICEIDRTLTEPEYETWKDTVAMNESDRFTPHTHIIEKAPVYKNAYDLLIQVFSLSVNVSRNVQNPLCFKLKELCYEMCYLIRNLYDCVDRNSAICEAKAKSDEIGYILQLLKDLKEISVKSFALACERNVSVSKQLTALRGKVTAKYPGLFDSSDPLPPADAGQ